MVKPSDKKAHRDGFVFNFNVAGGIQSLLYEHLYNRVPVSKRRGEMLRLMLIGFQMDMGVKVKSGDYIPAKAPTFDIPSEGNRENTSLSFKNGNDKQKQNVIFSFDSHHDKEIIDNDICSQENNENKDYGNPFDVTVFDDFYRG